MKPPACPALYVGGTVPFTGLYPAIEGKLPVSRFQSGMIVEVDFETMKEGVFRKQVHDIQSLPARVSVYLVGGHCTLRNDDCATLERAGVKLATTGSWNWDKEERRILDIAHPAVIQRIAAGAERGWRLGANYIRIDNLHHPAGSERPRTTEDMRRLFAAVQDVEDRLRKEGAISSGKPTGVVAHNNLETWKEMIEKGILRRPPVFLTSERTAQLAFKDGRYDADAALKAGRLDPADNAEISAGRLIAERLAIPYTIAEFQISHDLGGRTGSTYSLPAKYVERLASLSGVSEVIVIPSETHYVGRGRAHIGTGPRIQSAQPHTEDAGQAAQACLGR